MRICVIADAKEVHTRNWVADLRARGHDVRLLSFSAAGAGGGDVIRLRTAFPNSRLKYLTNLLKVRRIVAACAPDLVVGYYVTGNGLLAAFAGRHPLVLATSGDDVVITPWASPVMKAMIRWILSRADVVTAWGESMAEAARRLGVPAGRVFTLARGVDLARCDPGLRAERADPHQIVSTRKLAPEYQVDVVIRAFAELRGVRPDARLTLVGDGTERHRLEALVAALDVGAQVTFAGAVQHEAVFGYLHRADVYVSASYSEGTSNSLLEAMACGAFPIVADIPANREWVAHGVNGFLFPHRDRARLRECMLEALSRPQLLEEARLRNREIVHERADWRRNMAEYERLFRRLVAPRRSGQPAGATT